MNITTYLEIRAHIDMETETMEITSAWIIIKDDATNEVIFSKDMSDNEELLAMVKTTSISEDV